jgi:hypothetical protein
MGRPFGCRKKILILTSGGYSSIGEISRFIKGSLLEVGAVRVLENEMSSIKLTSDSVGLVGLPELPALNRRPKELKLDGAIVESFNVKGLAVRRLIGIIEGGCLAIKRDLSSGTEL